MSNKDVVKAINQLLAQINTHVVNTNNKMFADYKAKKEVADRIRTTQHVYVEYPKYVHKLGTIDSTQLMKALAKYSIVKSIPLEDLLYAITLTNDIHNYVYSVIKKKAE